ncbi:hypothetical protein ACFLTE_10520 [Bacteroidota bacterium]
MIQKIDPIFTDPKYNFVKSHFYAPHKLVFGKKMHTFWVNLIVIWFSIITLYIVLYYSLLRRLLESFEDLSHKIQKVEVEVN